MVCNVSAFQASPKHRFISRQLLPWTSRGCLAWAEVLRAAGARGSSRQGAGEGRANLAQGPPKGGQESLQLGPEVKVREVWGSRRPGGVASGPWDGPVLNLFETFPNSSSEISCPLYSAFQRKGQAQSHGQIQGRGGKEMAPVNVRYLRSLFNQFPFTKCLFCAEH